MQNTPQQTTYNNDEIDLFDLYGRVSGSSLQSL